MSAETTPTPVAVVPAEETGKSAPAVRRHSTTRCATRISAAEKAAREAEECELLRIVSEFCKTAGVTMEATVAIADPNIRARAVSIRLARVEAAKKAQEAEEKAERARKAEEARKLMDAMDAAIPPASEPVAKKAEGGNVVQLRPAPVAKPWQPKPAPTAAQAEAFQASIPVVVPALVFMGWEYAAGFRLCLLKAEQALRLELAEDPPEAYGRALRERRSFVLDTLNKGVNPVLERLYGFPDMRKDGSSLARAPLDVVADVRQRLVDSGWEDRLEVPDRPAEAKPETAEEKTSREAAEARRLADLKAAAEEKAALAEELRKRLTDAGSCPAEAGNAVMNRVLRVLGKAGATAEEKLTAAAVGSREAQASAEKAGQADQVEHHAASVALYAKAAGVTTEMVETLYKAKAAEAEAKAEQAKAQAFANSTTGVAKPLSEAAAKRQAEEARRAKSEKEKKNAQKKGNKGKGDHK